MADMEDGKIEVVETEGEDIAAPEASEEADEQEELVISIGEEPPPQEEETRAPDWVRELRKSHRELQKRNRELEAKLNTPKEAEKPAELGPKPKLEDFDYDEAAYDKARDEWHDRKREHDEAAAKARSAKEAEEKAWQDKLASYEKGKAALKVRDYEDAEAQALEHLSMTQQGVILQGSDKPELVVYALGKNPAKAKELASITDPVKFAFAVAKLETQLKVSNRNAPPPPEKVLTGKSAAGAGDSTLERLRAEAAKTGDFSKVLQYKQRMKQAG